MEHFQQELDRTWKSLLRLSEIHHCLFEKSNLKIINREELSQNPYISDELKFCKSEVQDLKEEIERSCSQVKEVIDCFAGMDLVGKQRHHQQRGEILLVRIVTRAIEVTNTATFECDNQYYQFYNQKFRSKCKRIIADIKNWELFEIIKVIYKYFRHIVLIELERYEEILECLIQADFQSLSRFKEYFYRVLQKKESSKKEINIISTGRSTPPLSVRNATISSVDAKQEKAEVEVEEPNYLPPIQQRLSKDQDEVKSEPQYIPQHSPSPSPFESAQTKSVSIGGSVKSIPLFEQFAIPPVELKKKTDAKSSKKLFHMLSTVMLIKKDHFPIETTNKHWQEKSIYSDLIGRNKLNHQQIESYFNYSQNMKEHLSRTNVKEFYYYQEEPQIRTERKHIRISVPICEKESLFASVELKKKELPLLSNNLEKRREHKTIHKSIDCRIKYESLNAESKEPIEQKPLKIDSQFLEISLRKVLPTKRQSHFDKLVARASSLGVIKQDLHHRRVQMISENVGKVIESDVFKSVKILHQNPFNVQKEVKTERELREKQHEPSHHDKIDNRIKIELRHGEHLETKPQDLKKIWTDRLTLKKLDIM